MKKTNDNCNKCNNKECNGDVSRKVRFTEDGECISVALSRHKCKGYMPIISKWNIKDLISKVTVGVFPTTANTAKLFIKYMGK